MPTEGPVPVPVPSLAVTAAEGPCAEGRGCSSVTVPRWLGSFSRETTTASSGAKGWGAVGQGQRHSSPTSCPRVPPSQGGADPHRRAGVLAPCDTGLTLPPRPELPETGEDIYPAMGPRRPTRWAAVDDPSARARETGWSMGESRGWVMIWGHGSVFVPSSALCAFPGPRPFTEGPRHALRDHLAGDVHLTLSQKVSSPSEMEPWELPGVGSLDHRVGPRPTALHTAGT